MSIQRQIDAGHKLAAARGWDVVATYTDDGVSATHNRPDARSGWAALLAAEVPYDVVVVWKVDRLARRTLDFLHACEALEARGAALVAVEDPIDMTTATGRAFATMLSVFAEMEAGTISAGVTAARRHLLQNGRLPGGTVPYGWRSVPNPDGAGYVLAQDPERIEYVRGAADRVRGGATLYSVVQWLNEVGAPLPRASQSQRKTSGWAYTTLERLIRNPVLAGMVAFNPGNRSKTRGDDVLRDADGLPIINPEVAIMSAADWRAMVHALDTNDSPRARPRAMRSQTSALLSGLVWCGECDRRMHRGTTKGRESYRCPACCQTISRFEDYVVEQFLWAKGEQVR